MKELLDKEPAALWRHFHALTQVPRPSNKEQKVLDFLLAFAHDLGLETEQDEVGNLLVRKPASPAYEDRPALLLQSHVDMVCEKNADVQHDFDNDPIQTWVDGQWLRAKGTTLGADDGIGVAAAMAVLSQKHLQHGPIESLFTVNEEAGMTGALQLRERWLKARLAINLDTEAMSEIYIGCAGGMDTLGKLPYQSEPTPSTYAGFALRVRGLKGGHSGDEIDKGLANSNKLMARMLGQLAQQLGFRLASLAGGNLRNAIPREADATLALDPAQAEAFAQRVRALADEFRQEFRKTEPALEIRFDPFPAPEKVFAPESQARLLNLLLAFPHGVLAMSQGLEGLVETSSNLAALRTHADHVEVVSSQRSSLDSGLRMACGMARACLELAGAEAWHTDGYPGWAPRPESPMLRLASEAHQRLFGDVPQVRAIHAGLECGMFVKKYPDLDIISIGPTMFGAHSPDERLDIGATAQFWKWLVEILRTVPKA